MARRRRGLRLDKVILGAAKDIRKRKLEFEREASKALSEALGFVVVVKIAKQPQPGPAPTLDMRRAMRKSTAEVAEMIAGQLVG